MTHNWPEWLPLRAELRSLSPYGAPQMEAIARLNTNENPYPPSDRLIKAITERIAEVSSSLNRYPDRDALQLRAGLATFLNERSHVTLDATQIWAANGSNEIIQSLFMAFGKGKALGFTPSYSMHPLIATVTGTPWVSGLRQPDFSIDIAVALTQIKREEPELIFLTTPNNPTGTSISLSDIACMAEVAREVGALLVVDEAYAEFSTEPSAVTLLAQFPNLVVIRTMSKAFAFAGVRLGYLASHSAVVEALQLVRLPYHLSTLTQSVALVALNFRDELLESVATLIKARAALTLELEQLGVRVLPSSANFLLFAVPSSPEVWQSLVDQGVLIRDVGLPGYLRVTIGRDEENELFLNALRKSLGGIK